MIALVVLLTVAVALLAALVVGLLRSHGEILRALHSLGIDLDGTHDHQSGPAGLAPPRSVDDSSVTDLAGITPAGDAIAIGVGQPGTMTLLAFLTSGCLTCAGFWDAFADSRHLGLPSTVRLVIVTKGSDMESPSRLSSLSPRDVPVVMSSTAWVDYGIQVAPYFVLVDGDRAEAVGEGAAATWEQVRSLLGQALDEAPKPSRRFRPVTDAERERRVDQQLAAAGIEPGDPRLHQGPSKS